MMMDNKLFEENLYIIDTLIQRHIIRIKAKRIEADDLRQELSISLIELIERFDPEKSTSLRNYLFDCLTKELYKKTKHREKHGITGLCKGDSVKFVYLDNPPSGGLAYGEERCAA